MTKTDKSSHKDPLCTSCGHNESHCTCSSGKAGAKKSKDTKGHK